jgi:AAA+ ATPase superfamily predicted ATPase
VRDHGRLRYNWVYNAAIYNGGGFVENPFSYGVIVTGKYFTDREEELAELKLDMRSGQNVVIISPRRYGKTSLVFQAVEELAKEGILIAYVDLMLSESKAEFANSLANALYDGLVAPFDRAWKKAGDFFSRLSLRPKFTVDDSGKPVVEITTAAADRDVDRMLKDLLALSGKVAEDRKKRVVVIMDEFQEVMGFDKRLPAVMRAVFQQQGEVSHVFLGSKRHLCV